ncbi:MAG: DNA starvation/stationary phase protection protein [Chlamydiota bacterium]|nr:DNA starvation/stationary phase protection protein [Chlamydiota bacterium]
MNITMEKSKNDQNVVVNDLKLLLADSYVLYVKTQNFHWNVIGPRFHQLHALFQEHYTELAEAIDVIAEQIRILNGRPPSSMGEFLELSTLEESTEQLNENDMLGILLDDNSSLVEQLTKSIESAQKAGDEGTADLLVARLRAHRKNCWMFKSHL